MIFIRTTYNDTVIVHVFKVTHTEIVQIEFFVTQLASGLLYSQLFS